jgi:hypothetical protein
MAGIHCLKKDRVIKKQLEEGIWTDLKIYFSPEYERWVVEAHSTVGRSFPVIWSYDSIVELIFHPENNSMAEVLWTTGI